jgi:hypothetical protein
MLCRFLGLSPHVPEQRSRTSVLLRALCKQRSATTVSSSVSAASLPLFGFDPDAAAEPTDVNFAHRGAWAHTCTGSFSLRLHVQAIHERACSAARLDASAEPALSQHPQKFASWQQALASVRDRDAAASSAALHSGPEVAQEDGGSERSACAADSSPLSLMRTFEFKCWPRTGDGECSVVRLG